MKIYSCIYTCPVGNLHIQCADDSVIAILFTEEQSTNGDDHPLLKKSQLQLDEYFAGGRTKFDLPFTQQGSAFQQKVWHLLYQIPFGKTVSYKELSHLYGDVKAIRAIASANGRNNLSIVVPCHRVIGTNRSLTGYAGGLWRKQWLLEHEAKWHSGVQQLF